MSNFAKDIVKKIQNFLGLFESGVFDTKLHRTICRWQKRNGLTVDGEVGELTLKSMGLRSPESPKGEVDIRAIIEAHSLIAPPNKNNPEPTIFDSKKHVVVVAIRGYNLNMGKDGVNDRRIYDDAHFIVTPDRIVSFEGNTDPNGYRKGSGKGKRKGMACLDTGVWFFGKGKHKGRPAFRQACPFRVIRDGDPPYPHTGYHAINWHSGGSKETSSLGCQTNRPTDFRKLRDYI